MRKFSIARAVGIFFRVFILVIAFTFDVKVRADVMIKEVSGQVEFEKYGRIREVQPPVTLTEPLDVQTFAHSRAKIQVNSLYVGVGERSLITCEKVPKCEIAWGTVFFSSAVKPSEWLTISTPEGEVIAPGGEFVVDVHENRTKVSVINGWVNIRDRASGTTQAVRAGFSSWIGGLLATGQRARGRLAALEIANVLMTVNNLATFTPEEWQARYDKLRPLWKEAIEEVAQETQDQVAGDLQILGEIQEAQEKRQRFEQRKRQHMVKNFKRRVFALPEIPDSPDSIDEPGENTAAPSESIRVPANSGE